MMTEADKAANKYAWEHTDDPARAQWPERAFMAGAGGQQAHPEEAPQS